MCGLAGFMTLSGKKFNATQIDIIVSSVIRSTVRGTDATGVIVDMEENRHKIIKQGVDAERFFEKTMTPDELLNSTMAMFHVRQGTHGSNRKNQNNHPIWGDKYAVLHNGIVTMDKIKGYKYKGECDTEEIVARLEKYGFDGLEEVSGTASLIIFDREKKDFYLWRHNNPLDVVLDDKNDLICVISDSKLYSAIYEDIDFGDIGFEKAREDVFVSKTVEDVLYRMTREGIFYVKDIKVKYRYYPTRYYNPDYGNGYDDLFDTKYNNSKKTKGLLESSKGTIHLPETFIGGDE